MINKISQIKLTSPITFKGQQEITKSSVPSLIYAPDSFSFNRYQTPQKPLDVSKIKALNIAHFRLVDSNSVRGITLTNQNENLFKELKEAGIETYIDLRHTGGDESKLAAKCNDAGIKYFNIKLKKNIPVFSNILGTKYSTKEFNDYTNNFAEQLNKLFKLMDKKKFYMACELGLHRTDIAVSTHYLFNRKEPVSPPLLSHMYFKEENNHTNEYIGYIKNLYRNLTNAGKTEMLNLPDSGIFNSRIAKLRIMNGLK